MDESCINHYDIVTKMLSEAIQEQCVTKAAIAKAKTDSTLALFSRITTNCYQREKTIAQKNFFSEIV